MVRLDVNPPSVSEAITDDIKWPPNNLYGNEPPLETDFHRDQIDLLMPLPEEAEHQWAEQERQKKRAARALFAIARHRPRSATRLEAYPAFWG
jgi:hypothetical protein